MRKDWDHPKGIPRTKVGIYHASVVWKAVTKKARDRPIQNLSSHRKKRNYQALPAHQEMVITMLACDSDGVIVDVIIATEWYREHPVYPWKVQVSK